MVCCGEDFIYFLCPNPRAKGMREPRARELWPTHSQNHPLLLKTYSVACSSPRLRLYLSIRSWQVCVGGAWQLLLFVVGPIPRNGSLEPANTGESSLPKGTPTPESIYMESGVAQRRSRPEDEYDIDQELLWMENEVVALEY